MRDISSKFIMTKDKRIEDYSILMTECLKMWEMILMAI